MHGIYNNNYVPEPQFLIANSKKQKVPQKAFHVGKLDDWKFGEFGKSLVIHQTKTS